MMSNAVTKHLPKARVLGELRDQPGILIRVQLHDVNAASLSRIENALQRSGASGWHWTVESETILKIRVYFQPSHVVKYCVVAVIGLIVLCHYNDIHFNYFGFTAAN